MNFLKKLFGGAQDAAETVVDVTGDMAGQVTDTTTHVASEAQHHMEEATAEAKEAMHDAAAGTMAEDVVEDTLAHDRQ